MKRVTSTITYTVPAWGFCNSDRLDIDVSVPKETCRFCVKTKHGHSCILYDKSLNNNDGLISKAPECCRATASRSSTIEPAEVPTVKPKELIKQTINLYEKTVKDLMAQGYPQPIATATAKKYILGG